MSLFKNIVAGVFLFVTGFAGTLAFWAQQPIIEADHPSIEFSIKAGSGSRSVTQQIENAGVPVNATLLVLLARVTDKSARMKAGNYALKPGVTPLKLLDQLVRGEFSQESLAIIEGWNFKQMRQAIAQHPALKHDTVQMSDNQLLAQVTVHYHIPEGLFFPDTYLFAKGASDLQIYRQAHVLLLKKLDEAWVKRDVSLSYKTPYEGLIMASIVEKETGQSTERGMIAGVFMNRLKRGMMLQTDPTVIYGMGDQYQGDIRKRDLLTDTPYNTYTRKGLPPTPIALPGAASLAAAFNPVQTDALYFVSRGNGTSQFSSNLSDHNRAVNNYQR
jgi:UPF0755 protein